MKEGKEGYSEKVARLPYLSYMSVFLAILRLPITVPLITFFVITLTLTVCSSILSHGPSVYLTILALQGMAIIFITNNFLRVYRHEASERDKAKFLQLLMTSEFADLNFNTTKVPLDKDPLLFAGHDENPSKNYDSPSVHLVAKTNVTNTTPEPSSGTFDHPGSKDSFHLVLNKSVTRTTDPSTGRVVPNYNVADVLMSTGKEGHSSSV